MRDKILAALKKLGPSGPTAIAREIGAEPHQVGYHMRAMEADKTLRAAGKGRHRYYGLPDQDLADRKAPEKHSAQRKPRKAPKSRAPNAAPAPLAAERFIPVVDAEKRLYIINGAEPLSFDGKQTLAIAELLFAHYEA